MGSSWGMSIATTQRTKRSNEKRKPRTETSIGRSHKKAGATRNSRSFVPFLLPATLLLALMSVFPLIQLLRMSVSEVTATTLNQQWHWVGVENFVNGFSSGETLGALGRTILFVIIVTVIGMGFGVAAAISMRGSAPSAAALLAIMVFVWALPPVVNGSVWKFLMADRGLFNTIVGAFGFSEIPFLYSQNFALVSVAIVNAWAVIPFNALVYRAAILNIPSETFEAAKLDGASSWQEVRYIILPALRPTTLVLLVLTLVNAFRSFDFIYVMTKGGPGVATNTLPFLGYLQAFVQYDFGRGAATSVIAVLLVLVLAVIYSRTVLKEESE